MSEHILHPTGEKLQGYIEGLLDESDRAALDAHLGDCTGCQSEVAQWRELFAAFAKLPQMEPAGGFANRVMEHVRLPDPWYVRAAARISAELQVFTPKTTRGWAFATATMAIPFAIFSALFAWMLSKPYVTPQSVASFAVDRGYKVVEGAASGTMAGFLQSDVALYFARALQTLSDGGAGAAGALAVAIAIGTVLSAWFLYQNLFRKTTAREDGNHVSYCF